ncbi:MAG TPA: hypothetical protein VK053_09580 [Jiangellaceae bacterium]|nr:hypothetical protein [Jiangellaceae bacterium]
MSDLDTLLRSRRQGTHPPITVREAQHMLDRVPTAIFSGADGGYTTPAPHGRHTWWFGDTVSVNGWLHNSTMIQSDGVLEPDPRTVIPKDEETGTVYWPAHAALLPDGRLLVPCGGLVPTSDWFENRPMRAAYVTVNDDGRVFFDEWAPYWPPGMDGGNAAQRYDAVVYDHGTGVLHTYAKPTETADGFLKGIFHRSVPLDSLDDPDAWSTPQQVVPYITDGSWSPWIDETSGYWFAVTMSLDTRTVLVYSAPSGEGPWDLVDEHPSPWTPDGTPGEFFYVLHAHPWMTLLDSDIVERDGQPMLTCTVSHTSSAGQALHDYRIRFLAIPYPEPDLSGVVFVVSFPEDGVIRLQWERSSITTSTPEAGVARLTWGGSDPITATTSNGVVTLNWTGA